MYGRSQEKYGEKSGNRANTQRNEVVVMNRLKYLLLGALISAVVCTCAVVPTLSWLSSKSEEVVNTFEGEQVAISIDEGKVDKDGKKTDDPERVSQNSYKFVAGSVLDKDPTPVVVKGSVDSYVFVCVENENDDIFSLNIDSENWLEIGSQDGKTLYAYKQSVDASASEEDIRLKPVFTKVTVSEEVTADRIKEASGKQFIKIQAFAIQTYAIETETAVDQAAEQFGISGELNYVDIV